MECPLYPGHKSKSVFTMRPSKRSSHFKWLISEFSLHQRRELFSCNRNFQFWWYCFLFPNTFYAGLITPSKLHFLREGVKLGSNMINHTHAAAFLSPCIFCWFKVDTTVAINACSGNTYRMLDSINLPSIISNIPALQIYTFRKDLEVALVTPQKIHLKPVCFVICFHCTASHLDPMT